MDSVRESTQLGLSGLPHNPRQWVETKLDVELCLPLRTRDSSAKPVKPMDVDSSTESRHQLWMTIAVNFGRLSFFPTVSYALLIQWQV